MRVRYWALIEMVIGFFFIFIGILLSDLLSYMDLVFYTAGVFLIGWGWSTLFIIKIYKLIRKT